MDKEDGTDPYAQLVDTDEVAELLGLTNPRGVSVYRDRYPDFPAPVVVKNKGRCILYRRSDITAWATANPRRQTDGNS